jgi:NADH-ubiquinone oxidoreductase chain 6
MKTITHFLFGFGILFTSFSVICLGDNPVLAVVFLIATFVLAAIYLILIGISFIGITYIILYVGAIAVLFLFVIMMLNLKDKDLIEPSSVSLNNGIYSFIIVVFFAYLINSLTSFSLNFKNLIALEYLGLKDWTFLKIKTVDQINNINVNYGTTNSTVTADQAQSVVVGNTSYADISLLDLTQIETLGQDLYTYGAVLLISLSIILLLAMFATIIISKPNVLQP